ncbi:MAG TPA: zinc ABC transporter substrate-binding protein [Pseudomonadales bacterium]|nr:zinc ABC transporter substrate-binding protein [Pseudomonadales bacterium]
MKKLSRIIILTSSLFTISAHASLNVFTCEPEWASLATEIGGDKVKTNSATSGQQDPHHIEARPSLIAKIRNADLLVCTGLELETGWLPVLLQQSGNNAIQPGQPANFVAGDFVVKLDIPTQLDRADGDVHPGGNPHIQLDPHNIVLVAKALSERMAQLDASNAALYKTRYEDFAKRWQVATQKWEQQAQPLRGVNVITHHKDMEYLLHWLGMNGVGNLEPKPGVEPSSAHLADLLTQLQQKPAKMILRTPYQGERASEWLAEKAKIPAVMIPNTVGGSDESKDLFSLYDDILKRMLGAK